MPNPFHGITRQPDKPINYDYEFEMAGVAATRITYCPPYQTLVWHVRSQKVVNKASKKLRIMCTANGCD